jgi:hypothetical protein
MAEEKMLWRNAKRQGSIAEYLFATEAMRQGFGLLMPLGGLPALRLHPRL